MDGWTHAVRVCMCIYMYGWMVISIEMGQTEERWNGAVLPLQLAHQGAEEVLARTRRGRIADSRERRAHCKGGQTPVACACRAGHEDTLGCMRACMRMSNLLHAVIGQQQISSVATTATPYLVAL